MEEPLIPHLAIPKFNDLFQGETSIKGNWVVANVETSVAWPNKVCKIYFRNRPIFIMPFTHDSERNSTTWPAVAVTLLPNESYAEGQVLLMHFLSSLSWVENKGTNVRTWTGGSLPTPMGGDVVKPILTSNAYYPYLPDPEDKKTRWALGFYREGLYLKHPAYQCLSFFKILNILFPQSKDQIKWIDTKMEFITDHQAKLRIAQIQSSGHNLGKYLYGHNRSAVAHAGGDPTFDPENPEDLQRFSEDLPLVKRLAEAAIEDNFILKSALTVYREHLYELEGFREVFGSDSVKIIKNNLTLPKEQWPQMSNLSIRLALHNFESKG